MFFRFYSLKKQYKSGRRSPESARAGSKLSGRRSIHAELWFKRYVNALADRMPDTGYYNLPSCQTVEGIYQTYREEIRAKQTGARRPISLSQFRRMWKIYSPKWSFQRLAFATTIHDELNVV
jgi:hypothetical protein